jgi:hypothetical protein
MSNLEDFIQIQTIAVDNKVTPEEASSIYLASIAKSMACIADDLHEINRKKGYEKELRR